MNTPKQLPYGNETAQERIRLAKNRTSRIVGHTLNLLALHESNQIIVYSPTLSAQIPRSRAAHAFNMFQHSMHHSEIVRLCALWDRNKRLRESIPTVIALIDHPKVLEALEAEMSDHFKNLKWDDPAPNSDPEIRATVHKLVAASNAAHGLRQARKVRLALRYAIREAKAVMESLELASLKAFRDRHLAHSLAEMRQEQSEERPVDPPKLGDERLLLNRSIRVVSKLYLGINGTAFMWNDSRPISRSNARALWEGCTFAVRR
jgi:AbiU2